MHPSKNRIASDFFVVQNLSGGYRYSFQNQENDKEIKGNGNSINYSYRMHDPRVGRFFAVDPLAKKYVFNSPYSFSMNIVIHMTELEGLEVTTTKIGSIYVITIVNADINVIERQAATTFTETCQSQNSDMNVEISVNTQIFDEHVGWYDYYNSDAPLAPADITAQGYSVSNGTIVAGNSSPQTFYFAQGSEGGAWSCGFGNVPSGSFTGFGGGIPLIVDGLKYGEKNVYAPGAPAGLPNTGPPGADNEKYLLQRSNAGYASMNTATGITGGKVVIGYNSETQNWIVVVQPDETDGTSLNMIRDQLFDEGYDNVLAFDGSSSATLVQDNTVLAQPAGNKDNAIPTGITISATKKGSQTTTPAGSMAKYFKTLGKR